MPTGTIVRSILPLARPLARRLSGPCPAATPRSGGARPGLAYPPAFDLEVLEIIVAGRALLAFVGLTPTRPCADVGRRIPRLPRTTAIAPLGVADVVEIAAAGATACARTATNALYC